MIKALPEMNSSTSLKPLFRHITKLNATTTLTDMTFYVILAAILNFVRHFEFE